MTEFKPIRYIEHTLPFLRESGGEIMFLGDGGEFLIRPERVHGRYRASHYSN